VARNLNDGSPANPFALQDAADGAKVAGNSPPCQGIRSGSPVDPIPPKRAYISGTPSAKITSRPYLDYLLILDGSIAEFTKVDYHPRQPVVRVTPGYTVIFSMVPRPPSRVCATRKRSTTGCERARPTAGVGTTSRPSSDPQLLHASAGLVRVIRQPLLGHPHDASLGGRVFGVLLLYLALDKADQLSTPSPTRLKRGLRKKRD